MNTTALTNLTLFWNDYLARNGFFHPHQHLSGGDVDNMLALHRAAELTSQKTPVLNNILRETARDTPGNVYSTGVAPPPVSPLTTEPLPHRAHGALAADVRAVIAGFNGSFNTGMVRKVLKKQKSGWNSQQIAVTVNGLKKLGEIVVTKQGESTWEGHSYVSVVNRKKLTVPESPPQPDQRVMSADEAVRYRRKFKMGLVKAHEAAVKSRLASVLEYFSSEDPNWRQSTGNGVNSNLYTFDTFRVRVTNPKGQLTLSPAPPWWDDEICGAA